MDLDMRSVRYFVVVADELHFGRAAARLHISQPALSKQVRRLEDELGFRLLVRDSRHVSLTPEGARFHREARVLLTQAARMTHPEGSGIRIAHIFDLDTGRAIADSFSTAFPDVPVMASSMDSVRQFDALARGLLDVAIIRVTPAMTAEHPTGWHHRLIRLEPFWLVGSLGDEPAETASLHDGAVEAFGDPPGSALYNVHGEYLTAFEARSGVELRWLGNPGTFDQCLPHMLRPDRYARLLEFESYALRYRTAGLPLHRPRELQPVYPWSIVWRDEPLKPAVRDVLETADRLSRERGWLEPDATAPLWHPPIASPKTMDAVTPRPR